LLSYPTLVGHIHLNKHSSRISLLGRLGNAHGLLFLFHIWIKVFNKLIISCESFISFYLHQHGVLNILFVN
jgi:hypothetical protein